MSGTEAAQVSAVSDGMYPCATDSFELVHCLQCNRSALPHFSCRCTNSGDKHAHTAGCRRMVKCQQCGLTDILHNLCTCLRCGIRHSCSGRVPSDDPPVLYTAPVFVRTAPRVLAALAAMSDFGVPGYCLPNLEPGGYDGLPRTPKRKERTPKKRKLTSEELDAALDWP